MKFIGYLSAALLIGCGGSGDESGSPYDSMFGPPPSDSKATPNAIYGLWAGATTDASMRFDIRMRVADGGTTMAGRCSFDDGTILTVGASAASRISVKPSCPSGGSCGEVTVLESKSDRSQAGDRWCAIELKPNSYSYTVVGLALEMEANGDHMKLIKISD